MPSHTGVHTRNTRPKLLLGRGRAGVPAFLREGRFRFILNRLLPGDELDSTRPSQYGPRGLEGCGRPSIPALVQHVPARQVELGRLDRPEQVGAAERLEHLAGSAAGLGPIALLHGDLGERRFGLDDEVGEL